MSCLCAPVNAFSWKHGGDFRLYGMHAVGPNAALAESLRPVGQRAILGGRAFIFEDVERQQLAALGTCKHRHSPTCLSRKWAELTHHD